MAVDNFSGMEVVICYVFSYSYLGELYVLIINVTIILRNRERKSQKKGTIIGIIITVLEDILVAVEVEIIQNDPQEGTD